MLLKCKKQTYETEEYICLSKTTEEHFSARKKTVKKAAPDFYQ